MNTQNPVEKNPFSMGRLTINPYLTAANLVFERLKWDIDPQSWASRRRLRTLRHTHTGEKAIILCNGPSLLNVDFNLLKQSFTFGLNKINLLYDQTDFRPSCIAAVNALVIQQNADFYNRTDTPLFLDRIARNHVNPSPNINFLHSADGVTKVAQDVSISINQGYTVTCVALQLALHMGFEKVALVGCDHNFAVKGTPNEMVKSGERDSSHFHPKYFADGAKWQLPDLVASEFFYDRMRETFESVGRQIVNCTDGGKLDVFERQDLNQFLGDR
jgi:hypothetical protein